MSLATADVSINTVYKLCADAGQACAAYHDANVRRIRAGHPGREVWSCYAKAKNVPFAKKPPPGAGDVWTWTALDRQAERSLGPDRWRS